ncbi:MAG: 1-phosphofructokinase [Clostridia bacterium]|nr:1-phosphofructokinase [Clostridia bacterium]
MIATITLNPSIDIKYVVDHFEKNGIFRAKEVEKTAGGKGLNVSKIIKILGEPVTALGLIGGKNGEFIEEEIEKIGIENYFTKIEGNTRNCIAILSNDNSQTEILENGPVVSQKGLSHFYEKYDEILERATIICGSGSLSQNIEDNIYKELIDKAKEKGVMFLLDTSGMPLKYGIEAAPFLIKPNKEELAFLTGRALETESDIIYAIRDLMKSRVQVIVVSLGSEGAVAAYKETLYRVKIPKIKTVNPVGSGDAMIGGFAVALNKGYNIEDMLIYGTACGISNAKQTKTGIIDTDDVKKFANQIIIEELSI